MTIEENMAWPTCAQHGAAAVFSTIRAKGPRGLPRATCGAGPWAGGQAQPAGGLLSGGQRQALTLLMATLVTPKLLLLDEHTAALDPSTAEKVLSLTEQIVAEKGHHLHDGDTQYILGAFSGQPHRDDGCRAHCAAAFRRAAQAATVESLLAQFRAQAGKKPG